MKIVEKEFGYFEGEQIVEYTLINNKGMSISCLNFGCVITKINVPDRNGNFENVVLGFDNFEDYLQHSPFFGAVIGRVAGRIKGAKFELDGKEYKLAENESANHLHGGHIGFNSVIWKCEKLEEVESVGLRFIYHSPHNDEGYPGNLETIVTYRLNDNDELDISYEAKTDRKTIVNLTNHSYFNLSGNIKNDCAEHQLKMDCDRFLELDGELLPTGAFINAANSVFDFQNGRKLKEGFHSNHPQNVLAGNGYDHPFIFTKEGTNTIELSEEESGRHLLVTTDQPCVVFYSGNQLEGPYSIFGVQARKYLGVCLETQGLPDAIHHSHFPSVILEPNQLYYSSTRYRFYAQ